MNRYLRTLPDFSDPLTHVDEGSYERNVYTEHLVILTKDELLAWSDHSMNSEIPGGKPLGAT